MIVALLWLGCLFALLLSGAFRLLALFGAVSFAVGLVLDSLAWLVGACVALFGSLSVAWDGRQ